MNPSEYFEFSDEAYHSHRAEREHAVWMLSEITDGAQIREHIAGLRDFYERDSRYLPGMAQLCYLAQSVTQSSEALEMHPECTGAFYEGEVLAFDVAEQFGDEDWPEIAETLFDGTIAEMFERYSDLALPEAERVQVIADETVALLHIDGTFLPTRPLETMIKQWAERLYAEDDGRALYMMMGFRYVLQQINRRAAAREVEGQVFDELMEYSDVDDEEPQTESINDIRDGILATFAEADAAIGVEAALGGEVSKLQALNRYTYALEAYVRRQDGLSTSDDIVASGPVTYVVYEDHRAGEEIELLTAQETIEGEFVGVEVMDLPIVAAGSDERRLAPVLVVKRVTVASAPVDEHDVPRFADISQDKYLAIVLSDAINIAHYE